MCARRFAPRKAEVRPHGPASLCCGREVSSRLYQENKQSLLWPHPVSEAQELDVETSRQPQLSPSSGLGERLRAEGPREGVCSGAAPAQGLCFFTLGYLEPQGGGGPWERSPPAHLGSCCRPQLGKAFPALTSRNGQPMVAQILESIGLCPGPRVTVPLLTCLPQSPAARSRGSSAQRPQAWVEA